MHLAIAVPFLGMYLMNFEACRLESRCLKCLCVSDQHPAVHVHPCAAGWTAGRQLLTWTAAWGS